MSPHFLPEGKGVANTTIMWYMRPGKGHQDGSGAGGGGDHFMEGCLSQATLSCGKCFLPSPASCQLLLTILS